MLSILHKLLAYLSRRIVKKYQPKIIGITGSVGKTSSRNAIFLAVSGQYKTRQTEKNYNNELGVPLTIIGAHAPGRNIFAWLGIFLKAISYILFSQDYPKVLVLEMGVDHPGDMDHLLGIVKPDIAVLTFVGSAHYEFFGSIEAVAQEKSKLIASLDKSGTAILNFDNKLVSQARNLTTAHVVGYGRQKEANVTILNVQENFQIPVSSNLEIESPNYKYNFSIPVLGESHVYAVLSAIAVAEELGIHNEVIQQGLLNYKPVPGRMNVFSGLRRTVIIDDSYNASPDSMKIALSTVQKFPNEKKVLVLGDMLELGDNSETSHREIGRIVNSIQPQYLVTSGKHASWIAEEAIMQGYPESQIYSYENSETTAKQVLNLLEEGQVILIKGSQGARMEKVSKEIMAEPMRSKDLLPRQYGKWVQ